MPRFDPYESLCFHCNLTLKAFVSGLEGKLKGTGVSQAQFRALAHLVALGPLSQSELADRLSITAATAVRLVDRMERDGWVIRKADLEDGRVKRIELTDEATMAWGKVSNAGRELLAEAYKGIPKEEIEAVKSVLEQVRRNLGG